MRSPRLDITKASFLAAFLLLSFVKAYGIYCVWEDRTLLPLIGPCLGQFLAFVAFSSAETWVAVYIQFVGAIAILAMMIVYQSKVVIRATGDGAKTVSLATSTQLFNLAMFASSLMLASSAPGMTRARRGVLMIATLSGFAPGGAIAGVVAPNLLVGSTYIQCNLGDANYISLLGLQACPRLRIACLGVLIQSVFH